MTRECRRAPRAGARLAQRLTASAALLLLLGSCATAVAPPPARVATGMPSPLEGPGQPPIERTDWRLVDKGWHALGSGDPAAARRYAAQTSSPQGRLLGLQAALTEGQPVAAEMHDLTRRHPAFAAAWYALSVAAEREGDETSAYRAAQTSAELWSKTPWNARAAELRKRWIDDRLAAAQRLIAAGAAEEALPELALALNLAPDRNELLLAKATALIALDRNAQADELLRGFDAAPAAVALRAEVAERETRWAEAMKLYQSLPVEHPDRAPGLRRSQLRWRVSIQPPYVQRALSSDALSRAELAIVLTATAPGLEAAEGGRVPVLSDIVDLPSQGEILTAVRTDLLRVDPLEHNFFPHRRASMNEVKDAVEALCHLLGYRQPHWCGQDTSTVDGSCTALSQPVTGEQLTEIILGLTEGSSAP